MAKQIIENAGQSLMIPLGSLHSYSVFFCIQKRYAHKLLEPRKDFFHLPQHLIRCCIRHGSHDDPFKDIIFQTGVFLCVRNHLNIR